MAYSVRRVDLNRLIIYRCVVSTAAKYLSSMSKLIEVPRSVTLPYGGMNRPIT